MNTLHALFQLQEDEPLRETQLYQFLQKRGIHPQDPRLQNLHEYLSRFPSSLELNRSIEPEDFEKITASNAFLLKALQGDVVIPDFDDFCRQVREIYEEIRPINEGQVASYIPQLARVEADLFAISICTVDGQVFDMGHHEDYFCLQSTSKPVSYALALEEHGVDAVHRHVGKEPSGRSFNEISLNHLGLPHNPLINAGAIMSTSLIRREQDLSDRFDYILNTWKKLAGNTRANYNNAVYLSERATADRNFALAYFMKENGAFPENTNLHDALDLYFQCCSIEVRSSQLASVAATFANGGVNPFTNQRIFSTTTVQNVLSMMNSCGMYDYSGEWAFTVGVPAKSGVSGAIWMVVPNVMGICVYAPPLDRIGNSVKGVRFAQELVKRFNFHNFDSLQYNHADKQDPRRKKYEQQATDVMMMIYAAANGDLDEVKRIVSLGIDINQGDYDGRTALHLAAAENRQEVVDYLLSLGADPQVRDRWGSQPLPPHPPLTPLTPLTPSPNPPKSPKSSKSSKV